MEIFRSLSRGFLLLSPVSLTELCSFWYGLKDLFTLHKLAQKVALSLTVKTDDVTKGRKDLDPHGQLRAVQGRMGYAIWLLHPCTTSGDYPIFRSMWDT